MQCSRTVKRTRSLQVEECRVRVHSPQLLKGVDLQGMEGEGEGEGMEEKEG